MKRLVYLAPGRWADFSQRPHKFVEWHRARYGSQVLWLEPYPTRLPQLHDLRRLRGGLGPPGQAVPPWLEVLPVPALPIEPLPGGTLLNTMLWKRVLARVAEFASAGECDLVMGKPSQLALRVLDSARFARTVYDAMDDFPAFHAGVSSRAFAVAESKVAKRVDVVQASSSRLVAKFAALGAATVLVRNACDPETLPALSLLPGQREMGLVGYVGTLASWFDWDLVIALAASRPGLHFRLIGPLHVQAPAGLPPNVELLPACAHPEAMRHMARFAVGLIPFRHNRLTSAVDPVKYYEYRALGVPVLSTAFGEMPEHARADPGVFLADTPHSASERLDAAMGCLPDLAWLEGFRRANSWDARFTSASA